MIHILLILFVAAVVIVFSIPSPQAGTIGDYDYDADQAYYACQQIESNSDAFDQQDPMRLACLGVIKAYEEIKE